MKYTLHIAFDENIGDAVLRTYERVKKFSQSESHCFAPLLLSPDGHGFEAKRPELSCPEADLLLAGLELKLGIFFRWALNNNVAKLRCDDDITEYFEKIYISNVTRENGVDPELHLLFYVPLYENEYIRYVERVIANLPRDYKFVVNIIAIPYDIGEVCGFLKHAIDREERNAYMTSVMSQALDIRHRNGILKYIILFQNRNLDGWSLNFNREKFVCTCADFATFMISSYHDVAKYVEPNRPIFAINSQSYVLDIYHAINIWIRDLFMRESSQYIIDYTDDSAEGTADHLFSQIMAKERTVIKQFVDGLKLDNKEYTETELKGLFEERCYSPITEIIRVECEGTSPAVRNYLYKKFSNINNLAHDSTDKQLLDALELDRLFIETLPLEDSLKDSYTQLEDCLHSIRELKIRIINNEEDIENLRSQITDDDYQNIELTEDGLQFANTIFKTNRTRNTPLAETYKPDMTEPLPPAVDLRSRFPIIKNQGQQGSCTAFSMVSVFEYFLMRLSGNYTDLSEAFTYFNSRKQAGNTEIDEGATFNDVLKATIDSGLCIESLCPYDEHTYNVEPSEESYADGSTRKVTEAKNVEINIQHIKCALAKGLPVVVSVQSIEVMKKNANGFVSYDSSCSETPKDSYHAMVICGYSDREGYFIVRNSWGKDYGDNGYCYFPYSTFRQGGVIDSCYVITGISDAGFANLDNHSYEGAGLSGNNDSAKYEILRNMLIEKTYLLNEAKKKLEKDKYRYSELCKQLGEREVTDLNLSQIDKQIAEIRKKKDDKSFIDNVFNGREDNAQLKLLINRRNCTLLNTIVTSGLLRLNLSYLEESRRLEETDRLYNSDRARIVWKTRGELESYYRQLSPKNFNISSLIQQALNIDVVQNILVDTKSMMSDIIHKRIGLYESLGELSRMVFENLASNANLSIMDYLTDEHGLRFFENINSSSIMAMLNGWVPMGYGEEVIYLSIPGKLPEGTTQLCSSVNFINSTDPYRLTFLHIERYDMEHFAIFNK